MAFITRQAEAAADYGINNPTGGCGMEWYSAADITRQEGMVAG
jgi:hypothetical protein